MATDDLYTMKSGCYNITASNRPGGGSRTVVDDYFRVEGLLSALPGCSCFGHGQVGAVPFREVLAALASGVRGSGMGPRCGCNFCVDVPVVWTNTPDGWVAVCGYCSRLPAREHAHVPRGPAAPAVAANGEQQLEERWKGWLPW